MSTNTERHEPQEERFDQEISRRWVSAILAGILGVSVLALVAMWWLSMFFVESGAAKDRVLTPVELERYKALLETEDTLQGARFEDYDELVRRMGGWLPPDIENTWPDDVEPPPYPRVQYAPMNDWLVLRHSFRQQLETFGWANEAQGLARVPVDVAIGRLVEQGEAQARPPLAPRSRELGGALGGTTPTPPGVTPEPEGGVEESGASEPEEPPADEGEGS